MNNCAETIEAEKAYQTTKEQHMKPSKQPSTIVTESESTTLDRNNTLYQQSSLLNTKQQATIETIKNKNTQARNQEGGFLMPFKRRQINRLRSASPPKPNLKLCTDNYIVYS